MIIILFLNQIEGRSKGGREIVKQTGITSGVLKMKLTPWGEILKIIPNRQTIVLLVLLNFNIFYLWIN